MNPKGKHGFLSWTRSVAAKLTRSDGHDGAVPRVAKRLKKPSERGKEHGNKLDSNGPGPSCRIVNSNDDTCLDRSVLALRTPEHDDPDRSASLHILASNLGRRYEQLGAMSDLHEAIGLFRDALALLPPKHPDRLNGLMDLASNLYCRYKQLKDMKDLQEVVDLHRDALALCPPEHPEHSDSLVNLAIVIGERYRELGNIEDLNEAIVLRQQVLGLYPPRDSNRSKSLMSLAIVLEDRYKHLGKVEDLNRAVEYGEEALELCPLGHPDRSKTLHILTNSLSCRFEKLGDIQDLSQAINFGEESLELCPQGNSARSTYMYNLANDLSRRYDQLGDIGDLNRAIGLGQEVLALRVMPEHRKYRSMSLHNLANDFRRRYHQLGDMKDLTNAIELSREALVFCPQGHPDRSRFLISLANDLSRRFDRLGDMQDLNEAIVAEKDALVLCPPRNTGCLELMHNLGIGLKTRYDKLGDIEDLNGAISVGREALAFCPPGHPDRLSSLNDLAYHLGTRYEMLEAMDDLNETIDLLRAALELCPPGHPGRLLSLNNLAYRLSTRYRKLAAVDDLNEAINLGREVLSFSPSSHSNQSLSSESLGQLFSGDSSTVTESCDVLSLKALQEVHSGDCSSAYEDAKKSVDVRPSTMGYIAMALAHAGIGKSKEALESFDFAQKISNPPDTNLLLMIKVVILFVAGKHNEAIAHAHDMMIVSKDDEIKFCYIQILGKMYLMQEDYVHALGLLKKGQDLALSCTGRNLDTISLIFGWSFDSLWITAQQCHCEALLRSGCAQEASQVLLEILGTVGPQEVTPGWVTELQNKCVDMLEELGDELLGSDRALEAVEQYSSALPLRPPYLVDVILKRSKARAAHGLWDDSLADANEAIKLDPSSLRGFEMKYTALHGAERYSEAIGAVSDMLTLGSLDETPYEEIRQRYTYPQDAITAINSAIGSVLKLCPLVLIDLTTGRLCGAEERVRIFKSESAFDKLVSEAVSRKSEPMHVYQTVAIYFEWVMFSHMWEGKEPTFKDVESVEAVWNLDQSPLNDKLRLFCTTARNNGHRWVWSDTCCIDRDTSAILSQSLTSMYSWYAEAAETLVYLSDVPLGSETGSLSGSRWMTRAWTLQELLASKVIRFYDNTWKPYLNDMSTNHKESPVIKGELAGALGVGAETITRFQPEDLGVREKLRLSSRRNATVEEDVAYSLIGIFSSDIIPRYGLGKTALGQLLESIVARSGDVTVIAWTGEALPYNSALPSSLRVYSQIPFSPPPMEPGELDTVVQHIKTRIPEQDALSLYSRVIQLPRANFFNRCLSLPCITFSVAKISVQELSGSQGNLYYASVSCLGKVKFRTADLMPLALPQKLAFVYPWLHDLRDHVDQFMAYDDLEAESYHVGTDGETDIESDEDGGDGSHEYRGLRRASTLLSRRVVRPDRHTLALRLIAHLERPFCTLLLEQQTNGQYKRVAAEHEIVVPGISLKTNLKHVRTKVLEVV